MYISLDYYRIFYHVALCRSFTGAAMALQNNQPNITRSIKNLEQELGCRLFLRSNRGVTLTPEGEQLFTRISAAMEQIQTGEAEISRAQNLEGGVVSIGATATALHVFLLPILKRFHQSYPKIRILISNHSTPQAVAALKNGLVDFAVVSTPTGAEKQLKQILLCPFQDILAAGADYAFLAEKPQSLSGLQGYPLISLGKATKTYEFYRQFYLNHGLSFHPDMETATVDQTLSLIQNSLGLGFLPEKRAAMSLADQSIHRISLQEAIPPRHVCLLQNENRPLTIAAREMRRMMLEGEG